MDILSLSRFGLDPSDGFRASPENPSTSLSDPDSWGMFGMSASASGVYVSNENAMRMIAVLACIRLLAETLASLPLMAYRRTSDGGKDRADDHDAYRVIHDQWNPCMTSMVGRETMQAHAVGYGDGIGLIERDGGGYLKAIWPVPPHCIEPIGDKGRIWYRVTNTGTQTLGITPGVYASDKVLHIPGMGYNGIRGYNPIALAREAIGLATAAEQFGARFFGQGATASGILTTDAQIGPDAAKRIRAEWNEIHSGVYQSHKTALLSHGLKYQQISVSPDDAQFLETRKFQLGEIARLFNVPADMIGAPTEQSNTYSNVEQRMMQFVSISFRPWLVRWEQELNRKLFTPREQSRYFAEFNLDGLLRGDITTQYAAFEKGLTNQFLTPNEVRSQINRNPLPGGDAVQAPKPSPQVTRAEA